MLRSGVDTIADRLNYLSAIQNTKGKSFRACDLAKQLNIDAAKIRVWLSRDSKKGIVRKTDGKKWAIISLKLVTNEIERIKRNNVTRTTCQGSTKPKKEPTAMLCRLHNVQFFAKLIGEDITTIPKKIKWDERKPGPGSDRWIINRVTVPELLCNAKIVISAGKQKASLQAYFQPFYTNGLKLFDQLEAVHNAAQQLLNLLSHDFNLTTSLLEIKRKKHFAISIPVKEGWRLAKMDYGLRGGKVWVNKNWWIDQSHGHELETANAVAFQELVELPGQVDGMKEGILEILNILKKPPEPATDPPPPTGEEIT